MKESSWSLRK